MTLRPFIHLLALNSYWCLSHSACQRFFVFHSPNCKPFVSISPQMPSFHDLFGQTYFPVFWLEAGYTIVWASGRQVFVPGRHTIRSTSNVRYLKLFCIHEFASWRVPMHWNLGRTLQTSIPVSYTHLWYRFFCLPQTERGETRSCGLSGIITSAVMSSYCYIWEYYWNQVANCV